MSPSSVERGRETRARLLDAATQLIAEYGWGGVTTRKVAERAGLRPGLVHYHFDSVDDLLIEASLGYARRVATELISALTQIGDGASGMDLLLASVTGYATDEAGASVFSEMFLAAARHPRLRQELAGLLGECRATLAGWLSERGSDTDPEATAALLLAVIDGLALHRLIDPGIGDLPMAGPLRRLAGLNTRP